jgi:peptidoglycan/LPS O-acetylase OafA/YrhL
VAQGELARGYRPQLDSVRAFAVLSVLVNHFLIETELGTLGVRLFFVLSGYLLTGILLSERGEAERLQVPRRRALRDFYVRRILRIWPAYYAALIGAVLIGEQGMAKTFAWHALFASNILFFLEQAWLPGESAHLWTLSVEEQFYLLLPLALLFVPTKHVRALLIGCIVAAIAYRAAVAAVISGTFDFDNLLPVASFDALGGGAVLAAVQRQSGPIDWKKLIAWSLPLALLLDFGSHSKALSSVVVPAVYILPMAGLIAAADSGVPGWGNVILGNRLLIRLGRISYGVYLYHLFVAVAADEFMVHLGYARLAGTLRFIVLVGLTVAVAIVSWFIIERPALSLKRYFRRSTPETFVPAVPSAV